ncbi:MAG TPA: GAF domain-containing protein [Terriglobales bacterium]|jgi:GAF domain-containing protein|nr:GAF domain-containing protein [Terriglobales bacterium]
MALHDTAVSPWRARVEDVLITGELRYRVPKSSSSVAKARATSRHLKELAGKNASSHEFLEALARAAREVCNGGAAGVSRVLQSEHGALLIRWESVAGELAQHVGATSPRNWSPSGATLDRKSPQLFLYPARCFHYLGDLKPAIVESLVVPIFVHGTPWGALWVVSHEEHHNFDQTDVEAISSLAEFAAGILGRESKAALA